MFIKLLKSCCCLHNYSVIYLCNRESVKPKVKKNNYKLIRDYLLLIGQHNKTQPSTMHPLNTIMDPQISIHMNIVYRSPTYSDEKVFLAPICRFNSDFTRGRISIGLYRYTRYSLILRIHILIYGITSLERTKPKKHINTQ